MKHVKDKKTGIVYLLQEISPNKVTIVRVLNDNNVEVTDVPIKDYEQNFEMVKADLMIREQIKKMLLEGKTEDEIIATLNHVKEHGSDNPDVDRKPEIDEIEKDIQDAKRRLNEEKDETKKKDIKEEIEVLTAKVKTLKETTND